MNITLLATAWGPRFGGINSFNRDFAIGLASQLQTQGKTFCAVVDPSADDIALAKAHSVTLIPIANRLNKDSFDDSWVHDVILWLDKNYHGLIIDLWIGHDIISGDAALRARALAGGSTALIHHMSYIGYQGFKLDSSVKADAKHLSQQRLFNNRAELFAVGPLLRQSCLELAGRPATQLVPGFPDILERRAQTESIVAVTFGRMEQASDRIKQGRLAVAGFGDAIKQVGPDGLGIRRLTRARLYVIGLDADLPDEETEVREIADHYAGRAVNVLGLPFDTDRNRLLKRLSEANLAMMLSWHEGFGLTGWEAVAAAVPLIISENSGLFQLIKDTLGGAGVGCVTPIDVFARRGKQGEENFTKEDLSNVSRAVARIAADLDIQLQNAVTLRDLLSNKLGCKWTDTARAFLDALTKASELTPSAKPPHLQQVSSDRPFRFATENAVAECADLTLSIPQGGTPVDFELLPELRFGRVEFSVGAFSVVYGLSTASLKLSLSNCSISAGERLGDNQITHPSIVAKGDAIWEIIGPLENGVLMRRALGTESLCSLYALSPSSLTVIAELTCRPRNLVYEVVHATTKRETTITQKRILGVFLAKCLARSETITLCRATLTTEWPKR